MAKCRDCPIQGSGPCPFEPRRKDDSERTWYEPERSAPDEDEGIPVDWPVRKEEPATTGG